MPKVGCPVSQFERAVRAFKARLPVSPWSARFRPGRRGFALVGAVSNRAPVRMKPEPVGAVSNRAPVRMKSEPVGAVSNRAPVRMKSEPVGAVSNRAPVRCRGFHLRLSSLSA